MLAEHPEIGKPRSGLHFFNRHFERGVSWYETRLADFLGPAIESIGEFSTTYSYPRYLPEVANRIADLYPDVKILASVRNPVDRAYSDFRRGRERGEIEDLSFTLAVEHYPELMDRGRYGELLAPFYRRFEPSRILVVAYDDINNRPDEALKRVFTFLGVDPEFRPEGWDRRLGQTYEPRSIGVERAVRAIQEMGSKWKHLPGLQGLSEKEFHRGIVSWVRSLNEEAAETGFSEELGTRLIECFEYDIRSTMTLTGLDLRHWLDPSAREA